MRDWVSSLSFLLRRFYETPEISQSTEKPPSTGLPSTDNRTTDNRTTVNRQRKTHNNKILNIKLDEYIEPSTGKPSTAEKYFEDETVNTTFHEFIADRKERKRPMTTRAINMAVTKIKQLSNGDSELGVLGVLGVLKIRMQ